ncbi:MAG: trimethylamine methyltransferase family protein [Armatimonadota bacterium]|nr:MAG: trimethylamine methyltransferase family protein [Armatimonadota bacterium]
MLLLPRPRLLDSGQMERIHGAAIRIVGEVGLRVGSPEALVAAERAGLRVVGERVFPDRRTCEEFIAESRAMPHEGEDGEEPEPRVELSVCQYANHVHDIESDTIVPFTTERLREAAKFVDTAASRGVRGKAPGCPVDVAPELQPVVQYKIGAECCRDGRGPVEVRSPGVLPYVMDMAEALGHRYTQQPIYVVSPLTLGGDSFECALAGRERLESVWVSNMSSAGGTAPIHLGRALALAVAEVMAAGIVAREVVGLPVEWSIRVCPLDPRTMALSLGSPEEVLFQWAYEEVNAFYRGREPGPPWGSLHSQAKLPNAQAAAERMAAMMMNAVFGTRIFAGAGRLSLDEVFSAEQLMIDCELRDHVARLISGVDVECEASACVSEVMAGVEEGFLGLESTARAYRESYWLPALFERRSLGEWLAQNDRDLSRRAKEMARESRRQYDYELEPELRRELERIHASAERELAG